MEPLADLPALQVNLEALTPRSLIHYLSPPGQKRGVFVTHGLYPPEELEKVRTAFAGRVADEEEVPARLSTARVDLAAAPVVPAWTAEVASLRSDLENLRGAVDALTEEVRALKSALGA
jgi:hypothetical protein